MPDQMSTVSSPVLRSDYARGDSFELGLELILDGLACAAARSG